MERRKFVVGLGALASGSAAAVGTGAFTSVTADRQVDVEVAGDASAYLGIDGTGSSNSSTFVDTSGGEVSFDFSSSNTNSVDSGGNVGNGFNPNSVTVIDSLLQVANQGTQSVEFYADLSGIDLSDGDGGQAYVALQPVTVDSNGDRDTEQDQNVAQNAGAGNIASSSSSGLSGLSANPSTSSVSLNQGEAIELDMVVDTRDFDPASGTSFPLSDDDGSIDFIADQSGI
ncbi:DUF1102 domain-containing protein [Halorubrum distributum]|uniref:DUF1102 domain-containing protein n=1 Tax=Halorubrum distributum TaxID=29283 RepID=UPI0012672299|nr:DUF1102 domain-containing protein [Halorubrum litoreum]